MAVVEVGSARSLRSYCTSKPNHSLWAHFWAPWALQCVQMNDVMAELAKEHPDGSFVKLEAKAVPEVSEKYEISYVPTFLFFQKSQKVDCLDGAHALELTKAVQRHVSIDSSPPGAKEHLKEDFNFRLRKLTHAAPCMLFMEGTPQEPDGGNPSQTQYSVQQFSYPLRCGSSTGARNNLIGPPVPSSVSGELRGGLDNQGAGSI